MSRGIELDAGTDSVAAVDAPAMHVLWLGDRNRLEFRAAWNRLHAQTRLSCARTLEQAVELAAAQDLDLAVIAQAFPGEFSLDQIERLRRADPLLPLISLLGSWCEGEMRSGQPWPGVPRLYWHQFEERLTEDLARLRAGRAPHWTEPVTASAEERFLTASAQPLATGQGLIVIDSPYFDGSAWLAQACRRQGYEAVEMTGGSAAARIRGARAAVWDGVRFDGELDRLQSLVQAVRPAPVVALLSFPRIDQTQAALAAGAAAVLSKPLRLSEFFSLLAHLPASS